MRDWLQHHIETFQFADSNLAFVNIKVLAEHLGLDWAYQREILMEEDHWGYREQTVDQMGGAVLYCGLPAQKVFIWLKGVDVSAVREELRRPLFDYQEESKRITESSFLQSDLLAYARNKPEEERSPLEQKLVEAAEMIESRQSDT